MTHLFAKFALGFADHPKIIGLSDKAFRVYVESVLYSCQHLTDGFIDERVAVAKSWDAVADELMGNDAVNASWQRVDGGFQIHGFTDKQTSKDQVEAVREKRRNAAKKRWESKPDANAMHNASKPDANAMPETETEIEVVNAQKGATGMKYDWSPSSELLDWAKTKTPNVDIQYQTERFVNYWLGTGKRMKNWDATWRNWMLKQSKEVSPAQADRGLADDWMKAKTWRPES